MSRILGVALLCCALPLTARADQFDKTVLVEAGGTLSIDLDRGSIDVETGEDNEVRIEASSSGFGSGSVDFELESDGQNASFRSRSGFSLGLLGGLRIKVVARVPEVYSVKVSTGGGRIEVEEIDGYVEARTSGGRIEVDGATGDVRLRTSGGRIQAENIGGDLTARTSGGRIRVSDVAGSVEARTSGGPIAIDGAGAVVRAKTSGGRISVRFDGAPEGTIETSGGSIDVEIPEGSNLDLDARTRGGRVTVDADIRVRGVFRNNHIEGAVNGGGGPSLRLRTSGGNITLEER